MNVVIVIFLFVCILWLATAASIIYMIIDITNMRRERRNTEMRMLQMANHPALPVPALWSAGHVVPYRATDLTPETRRALEILGRQQEAFHWAAFHSGSQALRAADRCDICGASTPDQKTERCRDACKSAPINASLWTGRLAGDQARQLPVPPRGSSPCDGL